MKKNPIIKKWPETQFHQTQKKGMTHSTSIQWFFNESIASLIGIELFTPPPTEQNPVGKIEIEEEGKKEKKLSKKHAEADTAL